MADNPVPSLGFPDGSAAKRGPTYQEAEATLRRLAGELFTTSDGPRTAAVPPFRSEPKRWPEPGTDVGARPPGPADGKHLLTPVTLPGLVEAVPDALVIVDCVGR